MEQYDHNLRFGQSSSLKHQYDDGVKTPAHMPGSKPSFEETQQVLSKLNSWILPDESSSSHHKNASLYTISGKLHEFAEGKSAAT